LPEIGVFFEQLAASEPGLIVIAGLDPPTVTTETDGILPSGRSAIFRILIRHILTRQPTARAIVVTETKETLRVPRQLKHRVEWALVQPPYTYTGRITHATVRRPELLVIDQLDAETAPVALQAAQSGIKVMAQMDTIFIGSGVVRQLLDLGVPRESLSSLAWVITVQRWAMLCPGCKQPEQPAAAHLDECRHRYPRVPLEGTFFRAGGCVSCNHTGRQGQMAVFDVFRAETDPEAMLGRPSLLPMQEYILRLAVLGHVPLDDAIYFEGDRLRRIYGLFASSERALAESNAILQRRLAELEAANKVLLQRTEALISLEEIGHMLVTSDSLGELASRVCRRARDLCGADRAILYFLRPDSTVEVLDVCGWDTGLLHRRLDAAMVMGAGGLDAATAEPTVFPDYPPGVEPAPPGARDVVLRAGLRMPLIAQQEVVGLMIVHTTTGSSFAPGQVALLQAFANQAALAIQRAGLIDSLRDKIAQLEAAQAELVHKERLERELELARQVQQRLLPRTFPLIPGFAFAARCEPARRVGGDFYDVILLDADRFGIAIADVSDKGMPAALFMALTRSLLLAEARREHSPRAVLSNVHRLLLELGEPDMFVTAFYGVVEVSARRLTYTRAGHDRPLLLRDSAVHPLSGEGTFLGGIETGQLNLSEEQISLHPGDRLVLYTDGLIDAMAVNRQLFGLGRFVELLESVASLAAEGLCDFVFEHLVAYQGTAEQYDDMTMLVVQVK